MGGAALRRARHVGWLEAWSWVPAAQCNRVFGPESWRCRKPPASALRSSSACCSPLSSTRTIWTPRRTTLGWREHGCRAGKTPPSRNYSRRLHAHLDDLQANAEPSAVNGLRAEVLAHVRQGAAHPQGVFGLTVPTGGGKTLASLAFALDHAVRQGLDRVIYSSSMR